MKNAPNLDLLLLARQWGATAVPFSEASGSAWLDTTDTQRALTDLPPSGRGFLVKSLRQRAYCACKSLSLIVR